MTDPSGNPLPVEQVLDITRKMAGAVDLDELLGVIIERSCGLLAAERASIFLYEPASNELVSRIATGEEEIRFPADTGIAGATVASGGTINIPDAYADPRFNRDIDRQSGFRTRNILSVPLLGYEGETVGVLQVLNKHTGPFGDSDVQLAETLAAQAGVSLQRARLIEHYVEKQRMARSLQIAREIQQGLLPDGSPDIDGFDVAGFGQPADETGGDTYDYVPLDNGRWLITVADASGHGVGPALVIAETRAMLRAASCHGAGVSELLQTANRLLAEDLEGRFVTCFLGLLDPSAARLTYASAGHGPVIFYRAAIDGFAEIPATAMPLGILAETDYSEILDHDFLPGDFAVITTDGFFEAADAQGEQFGVARMLDVLRSHRQKPAEEMIAALHAAVAAFTAGQPQADDLTAVLIKKD
ncbi:MAG: PP2C family protein-serine/threonine phosphatase [Planctomycetota bacterium]|jgi:phosphoserine phosphatase